MGKFRMRGQFSTEHIIGSLSPEQLCAIDAIGAALFAGHPMRVGFKGLVSSKPTFVTQVEKDHEDGRSEGPQRPGPTAGSRTRRQRPSRPRPRHPDSSDLLRWAVGEQDQVDALKRKYPSAKMSSDQNGKWLAVRTFPIGIDGPQVLLLIAVPTWPLRVLAWAYWFVGPKSVWIGPRHTNFNEGSVCAFPLNSAHLDCDQPLRLYIDLLSEWCARHLYLARHKKWPGPQEGLWPSYRLNETQPGECCPRCGSLRLYEECCKALDEADVSAGREGPNGTAPMGNRRPPPQIAELAKRSGRNPPKIESLFGSMR
jgi:hypothetical protein